MNKKQIHITLITILIIVIIGVLGSKIVNAKIIEKYKTQIEDNDIKIELIEDIKKHLHITAELVRKEENFNNGFDLILSQKWYEYNASQQSLIAQNAELNDKIAKEESKRKYVGNFKITHYCPCATCNGSWGNKTAIGTTVTPYKTIAVDPKVIPLGSKVEILGVEYIAEDTGGAIKGKRIDICVGSHSEAYTKGVLRNIPVYIINE